MRYFDHDTTASDDDAIMALRLEHGGAAVDAYWTLLEKMYREERPLTLFTDETNAETKSVAHRLCIGSEELENYVNTMCAVGLFERSGQSIFSARAMLAITAYQQRAETARQNGKKGGRKPKAKPTRLSHGNQVGKKQITTSVAIEEKRSTGSYEKNQYQYEDGACADGTAPPSCFMCQRPMEPTSTFKSGTNLRLYRCEVCGEEAFA